MMMKWYTLSLRGMIGESYLSCGARKMVRLDWMPSGSRLHKWIHRRPMEMLDDLVLFAAGEDVYGSFSVDSSHRRFNRYRLVDHPGDERRANRRRRADMTEAERKATRGKRTGAPSGKRWVRDTCKHHEMASPNGGVLASVVTDTDTSDPTVYAELRSRICRRAAATPLGTAPTARKKTAPWPSRPDANRTLSLGRTIKATE